MANRVVKIPDYWLAGACRTLEREGMGPRKALRAAVALWMKQEELEREFKRERGLRNPCEGGERVEASLHRMNPRPVLIYDRLETIFASKAGMPHKCDEECEACGHRYRHDFDEKACVYGLPDGSFWVRSSA